MSYDVVVVGMGYIGLPTAAMLATNGRQVFGLEVNPQVVSTINQGQIHIVEPGLEGLVQSAVGDQHLCAGTNCPSAETYIIAVPTPLSGSHDNPTPDLSMVRAAARSIAPMIQRNSLVVLESTSPIGTTEQLKDWIDGERASLGLEPFVEVDYCYCPERILPGQMIRELVENDRVVGGLTPHASLRAELLYRSFCEGEIHLTNARTAEAVKLAENASRDCQIAFANELDLICNLSDVDTWSVIELANRHPRVDILKPGPGVGGHCIAVDPWFLAAAAPEHSPLIRASRHVNDTKPLWVVDQVVERIRDIDGPRIACLGLAFKANVDDLRESPALRITQELASMGGVELLIAEPNIEALPPSLDQPHVTLMPARDAIDEADVVLLLVDHDSFQDLDQMQVDKRYVIDTRGMWAESPIGTAGV
jgi:UDP-N-acetyl-D-mannosaminuronic acid dehydrogenase